MGFRPRYFGACLIVLTAGLAVFSGSYLIPAEAQNISPVFSASQAKAGETIYTQQCATCHGAKLNDGEFAPPLSADEFIEKWGGRHVDELYDVVSTTMPLTAPGSLNPEQVTSLLAYILENNHMAAGDKALPSDPQALKKMILTSSGSFAVRPGVVLPPSPVVVANPLEHITPVTELMLRNPPKEEWLTWRRTPEDEGFSPLRQINKTNVSRLRLAWQWALPNGPNEVTPIVHDGVMFVFGQGDVVQALNAANGDLLWQYSRRLPKGVQPSWKKSMAILGNLLYVGTSDVHVVALDIRTGDMKWDTPLVSADVPGLRLDGGPLVAKDKVIVGTAGRAAGGNYIVAVDAESGKESWRFRTIPEPGTLGGDSWNGVPLEKRTGGSIWTPGSYDPETNLVFFGPTPTYDTAPLRDRVQDPKVSNDALFTNTTLAIDPETGKLVWYYTHLPNDQWDLDWGFERQIFNLNVKGTTKRVVVTAGKEAIYDVLDAKTGKYQFSMDLGLQDLVKSINPETGFKTIDREDITPGDGRTKSLCPSAEGGKEWLPGAYNPDSKLLFVPLVEACMDYYPVTTGGLFTTNVGLEFRPRPGSDGNYGRLEAINLETRKSVWAHRERAPSMTGALATAGGLVFAGYMDRGFGAFDDATGKELWRTRLSDIPNSNAISYAVNGKQYIAVIAGSGGIHTRVLAGLVPEIKTPPNRSANVSVFELPDSP